MTALKITMTLLIRDEEDIIEEVLRFHRAQGVDHFIVMDNLSRDATPSILSRLAGEMSISVLKQQDDDYAQGKWVTQMARLAARDGADWIINSDADEFWMPRRGTLHEYLANMPEDVAQVDVSRHNAVVSHGPAGAQDGAAHPRFSTLFECISTNSQGGPLPGKCLHRASENITVAQGNHSVSGLSGRKTAAGDELVILHFPYRSLDHYRRKIAVGGAAYQRNTELPANIGATWREHYDKLGTDHLTQFWTDLSLSRQEGIIGMLADRLFRDERLARFLDGSDDKAVTLARAHRALCDNSRAMITELARTLAEFINRMPREVRPERPLYYNLEFSVSGPNRQLEMLEALPVAHGHANLCRIFPQLRDIFSLFPRNDHLRGFLAQLVELAHPEDVRRLREDCADRQVVLHGTCQARLARAEASADSFAPLGHLHHILLVGDSRTFGENETPLSFSYDGRILRVPTPDDYENLHRKLFYAFTLLDLVANPEFVIKLDDNIHLDNPNVFSAMLTDLAATGTSYAGRAVGAQQHKTQWHGWHLTKCADPVIETRGYQYPLPRIYAAGGYGYILGRKGLAACGYMYLAMKEFFAMRAVGLEDACAGHAIFAEGLELRNVSTEETILSLPGTISIESRRR